MIPVSEADRPLLFVDIDGVLNPYDGPCPEAYAEHWLFPEDDEPVRVCHLHGVWLHQLSRRYDLIWGTAWSDEERDLLHGVLDLPSFQGAIDVPRGPFDPAMKVPAIARVAGQRATAWIDDLLTSESWTWARERAAPTLLLPVDPAVGLTRQQVQRLLDWEAALRGGHPDSPR